MAKAKNLAALALIPFLICLASAQDKIISHIPNLPRIARAWNSIAPATKDWNAAMEKADALIHERFNPKIVVANPDEKRKEAVVNYKAAKEALLKQLDALNELIDEEEW
ncbi:MAG: hypothetical protein ABJB61_15185 [bacterium]